jgi:hypothetical protein
MAGDNDEEIPFSMVQEAVDSYSVESLPDGRTAIQIVIPARFVNLWLVKLSELHGTRAEMLRLSGNDRSVS